MADLQFAVLQTDSVLPQFQAEHSDYPQMFQDLLVAAGVPAANITTVDVREQVLPPPQTYDAYVITGSRLSVYDDEPWIPRLAEFVGAAMSAQRCVVGICFGHQLLAHFFGGRVEAADVGWAVGVHTNSVLHTRDWMQPPLQRFDLISSHQDQVTVLPPDARLLAQTPLCPYAAFELGQWGLAIQGHPEFSPEYAAALLNHRRELLGDDLYASATGSLRCAPHNAELGRWIVAFVQARMGAA